MAWLMVGLLAALVAAASARAQMVDVPTNRLRADFWDADGPIHAVAARGGVIYVGGTFSSVAPRGRKVSAVDAYTAEPRRDFPAIVGAAVHAIVPDGEGGWYIGGEFIRVGNEARTNLVRIRSDDSVDPNFAPHPSGPVRALALSSGPTGSRLYLGGGFLSVGGVSRARLAALDLGGAGGVVVAPWNPGADDTVQALLLSGDTIYVGGRFLQAGGAARSRLAALSTSGDAALPWQPSLDGEVVALGLLPDRLVAGGNFNVAGGLARNGLAAFHLGTGTVVADWNPDPRDGPGSGGKVTTVQVDCDTVYVGGFFSTMGGIERARVAAVDAVTGGVRSWNPGLGLRRPGLRPSAVRALAVVGDRVLVGGEFQGAGGLPRRDLVAVDAATGRVLAWNPAWSGGVTALGIEGRTVLGAHVTGPGGVDRNHAAAFAEATGQPTEWRPDPDGPVQAIAVWGTNVYLGGAFTNVAGASRLRLAAVDALTGVLRTQWVAQANSNVQALAVGEADGRLYVGGRFTLVQGEARRRVAAVDLASGAVVAGWAPPVEFGQVQALAVSGPAVYLGGTFTQVGGVSRLGAAAVATAGAAVLPWDPSTDGAVQALAVAPSTATSEATVYLGGRFTRVGGVPRAGLAAVTLAGAGVVAPWNPGELVGDLEPDVRALAVADDRIYVAGGLLGLGGELRFGVGLVDRGGGLRDWRPGVSPDNLVAALALSDESVYAGGAGGTLGESVAGGAGVPEWTAPGGGRYLGVFPRAGAPEVVLGPREEVASVGQTVSWAVLASGPGPFRYQWFHEGVALAGQTNLVLTLTNVQVSQAGTYEVRLANDRGRTAASGTLVVLDPVRIVAAPASVTASTGSNVVLTVAAEGSPSPIYQWRLNGVFIPGAVYPTLALDAAVAQDGGRYDVMVANRTGALIAGPAFVTVQTNLAPFSDAFAGRGLVAGTAGTVRGSNIGATREETGGEPRHAGKAGGASVWLRWVAPADGVAVASTRGSAVDTVLGVYTGATLDTLGAVASDEDQGGFLTSRAIWNARAGVEYQLAIDTVGGVAGELVFSWELRTGAPFLPVIGGQPLARTVMPGDTASFSVAAVDGGGGNASSLRYQWYFGCQALPGATNATLTIPNARSRDAGFYRVSVENAAGQMVWSLPAALELGVSPAVRSFEKLEDLLEAGGPPLGGAGAVLLQAGSGSPVLNLSLGLPVAQVFNTSSNTPGLLFSECGTLSGAAVYFAFVPGQSGRLQVDTIGSTFDTVLSLFRSAPYLQLETNRIACDNDGAPDRVRSVVTVDVVGGRQYLARVSGVGGARGLAQARWHLATGPVAVQSNQVLRWWSGTGAALDAGVSVSNNLATSYQWYWNGARLWDGTNAVLTLPQLDAAMAGSYSVVVSNFAGAVTNLRATVEIRPPLKIEGVQWSAMGTFSFHVTGGAGELFAVERSTNLLQSGWELMTNGVIPAGGVFGPWSEVAGPAGEHPRRFYRVRPR